MDRRSFLGSASITASSYERITGAGGSVRLALIGSGGRGRYVTGFMREMDGVQLAACADVDLRTARKAAGGAEALQDFRPLLGRKDIDAVVVATPDHWHAGVAALACRAGKHVYIEKPLTHNIGEGRALVKAGGTVVQAGLQHRSAPHFEECAGLVRSGALGKVHFVRIWNANNMGAAGIGTQPDGDPPAELDWDFYCGPAPLRPYNPLRVGPTFRWFRDYASGFITDFGAHRFGTVHHIMGVDAPRTVSASGGRFAVGGMSEMPDLIVATYEYEGFVLSYEGSNFNGFGMPRGGSGLRHYNQRGMWDRPNGMAFHGTEGTLFADRIGYEFYPEPVRPGAPPAGEAVWKQGTDATRLHAQAFIRNIRDGRKPEASAEFGHRVTSAALLGNIALMTGVKLRWDAGREEFPGGPRRAAELLGRRARKRWALL